MDGTKNANVFQPRNTTSCVYSSIPCHSMILGATVVIIWHGIYSVSCNECEFSDSKDYYQTTSYTPDINDLFYDIAWSAPQFSIIKITADNIADALGIPTNFTNAFIDLINKSIVTNIPSSMVDEIALYSPPATPPRPVHECE